MNVFLRLTLACSADDAWDALQKPSMLQAVSKPLMHIRSAAGLPERWNPEQPVAVSLWLFGIIPFGKRTIDISYSERPGGVRMLIDQGETLGGPLGIVRNWDHRMAVSPAGENRTLYRDRLVVRAGILTFPVWLSLWVMWQYRARRIARLARTWG